MDEITSFLFLKLVRLLVGIVSFIGLLSLDAWKAWKSKALWVPQGALVLSAFSLQLLDLLDTDNVSISDYPETKRWELERVLRNGLWIDGGRVVVCVYMGYLLPEMARSPSKRVVWGDLGESSLPSDGNTAPTPSQEKIPVNPLSLVSRVCTGACAILLFLILGSAVFAGKTLHNLVFQRIPVAIKEKAVDYEPENVEKEVLRSWVVAWVCKPDYIIARSVLASSVGVVVTLPVVCFAAEWTTQDYQVLRSLDGIDWFRYTVTAFTTLLILIGWGIIVYRWMFSIYYFPGKYKIPDQGYFHVEDFWIREIVEVMDDIEFPQTSWVEDVSGVGFPEKLKLPFFRARKVRNLLRYPLLHLQRSVVLFSRLCCFLSEKIVFVCKTRLHTIGAMDSDFYGFKEALDKLKMPGETQESLFAGSAKAFKKTKGFMEKGRIEGRKYERLIHLLRTESTDRNSEGLKFLETLRERLSRNFPFDFLREISWKMTALSLIQVLIELEGRRAYDYVGAYSQAYDFLDLLDNPPGTDAKREVLMRAADKKFIVIKKHPCRNSALKPEVTSTTQEAWKKVKALRDKAEKLASFNPNDSVNWSAIAANNNLGMVCTFILENHTVPDSDLMNKAWSLLSDMLAIALRNEVGRELVKNCRAWAEMLDDEKIRASVYIAGKLSGVVEKINGSDLGIDKC